jgi:hypothetical protein
VKRAGGSRDWLAASAAIAKRVGLFIVRLLLKFAGTAGTDACVGVRVIAKKPRMRRF